MAIKLIKTYSPNENATRLKQQEQDAQTIEDALNKQSSDLDTHENAKIAHSASQISYEGTNVDTALKAMNAYVDNLVIEASKGDSNAEVVAARTNYDGTTDTSLKNRLDRYAQKTDNGQNFKLTQDTGLSSVITAGDLNDYKTPGYYFISISSGSTDVLNMPTDVSGFLQVSKAHYSDGTLQIFIPYRGSTTSNSSAIYYRNYGVGVSSWVPWAATADKTQTEASIASVTSQKININTTKITDATSSGDDYPVGITVQEITAGTGVAAGFPSNYGIVHTVKYSNTRMMQYFYPPGSTSDYQGAWARYWFTNVGWSKWHSLFGNNSWCNVSVTAEQSLTQAVTQKVKFNRIINDSHSQFNTSNSRFIAKVRGMYMVGVGLYIYQVRKYNNIQIFLYKNGTHYKTVYQLRENPHDQNENEWNTGHYNSGVNVPLEVGDYLEIFVHVGSGQDLRISDKAGQYNYFDIYRFGDIPLNVTI
ncbi:hypothetical protein M8C22_18670 [Bacillus spizizenii]|uniref:C1q-like domain-containing protein n=1 Tax=Bacillus spizizenii TaxID=96241 RepID=UPI003F74A809